MSSVPVEGAAPRLAFPRDCSIQKDMHGMRHQADRCCLNSNDVAVSAHGLGEFELQIQRVGIRLPVLRSQIPSRGRLEVLDGVDSFFISVHIDARLLDGRDGASSRFHGLREVRDVAGGLLGVRRVVFRLVAFQGLSGAPGGLREGGAAPRRRRDAWLAAFSRAFAVVQRFCCTAPRRLPILGCQN